MRCRGCKTEIDVAAATAASFRQEAAKLVRNNQPMEAMALFQRSSGLDLRRGKGASPHITKKPGNVPSMRRTCWNKRGERLHGMVVG
jgi:hypothetical protein